MGVKKWMATHGLIQGGGGATRALIYIFGRFSKNCKDTFQFVFHGVFVFQICGFMVGTKKWKFSKKESKAPMGMWCHATSYA